MHAYERPFLVLLALGWMASCGPGGASSTTTTGSAGAATTGTSTVGSTASGSATGGAATGGTSTSSAATGGTGACGPGAAYDAVVLCDHPVTYWAMNKPSGSEPDLTGNHHDGTYHGGTPALAAMPNGDQAADFDGASQYLSIPSSATFSIPTTGNLTWEAWIRPDVLQFPKESSDGYVDWMGKCDSYAPTCEWEARMYDTTNPQGRCNRLSAYVFNPSAGLGSGADWQPACGLFQAGQWYHVVGAYTTQSQPSACPNASTYPGSINIWVNGVLWDQSAHSPTGCMSQYQVVPKANGSALNIGTMALDTWFKGAIGKVAVYDHLLGQAQITSHYQAMTGKSPQGSCANTCSF